MRSQTTIPGHFFGWLLVLALCLPQIAPAPPEPADDGPSRFSRRACLAALMAVAGISVGIGVHALLTPEEEETPEWTGLGGQMFDSYDPNNPAEVKAHSNEERSRYILEKLENPLTLEETFDAIIKPEDQLIVLAEDHFGAYGEDFYAGLLPVLKKKYPNLRYIFLEYDRQFQEPLDEYFAGKGPAPLREYAPFQKDLRAFDGPRREGVKILLVDTERVGVPIQEVLARNKAMAETIGETLSQDEGAMGVLIVGKAHAVPTLYSYSQQTWATSIPELTRNKGIKTKTINLLSESEYGQTLPPHAPNVFGFLPGRNTPVARPRIPKPEPGFLSGDLYPVLTGAKRLPDQQEYLQHTRPIYYHDMDGVLFFKQQPSN